MSRAKAPQRTAGTDKGSPRARRSSALRAQSQSSGTAQRRTDRRHPWVAKELEASLELADAIEQLAYEHGAGVVETEVTT
jgi:hypothetical protein